MDMYRRIVVVVLLAVAAALFDRGVVRAEPRWSCTIVACYPHDSSAFTQGLVFDDGLLVESTGLYGESSVRKVNVEDGAVVQASFLDAEFFGEGITVLGDQLFQLTWKERRGFVYDLASLGRIATFFYSSEGWGLTTDGVQLIMSDGSAVLTFLEAESYEVAGQITVRGEQGEVCLLNELEYVEGEIYANIWYSDWIVRIDPGTGNVLGWIDLRALANLERAKNPAAEVLNGIAYDREQGRLFVTGKLWSSVYEIRLVR